MDLYRYLDFFHEYQYDQTYYPPLNDLDLICDVNSEEEKQFIAYSLLGEVESAFSDKEKINRIHQNVSKYTGIFLDYDFFVSVVKKMTFTIAPNKGLNKTVIRGALYYPDKKIHVPFLDINPLVPEEDTTGEYDDSKYYQLRNSRFKILKNN